MIAVASAALLCLALVAAYALEAFRAVDRSSFAVHRSPYVCSYMCVEERAQSHNLSAFPTASVGTVHGMRRPAQSQSAEIGTDARQPPQPVGVEEPADAQPHGATARRLQPSSTCAGCASSGIYFTLRRGPP